MSRHRKWAAAFAASMLLFTGVSAHINGGSWFKPPRGAVSA
jgi:hypothetical protein